MTYQHHSEVLSAFQQTEIERKFLVHLNKMPPLSGGKFIEQGYLNFEPEEIRIRITNREFALIIVKAISTLVRSVSGEYIPLEEGIKMLNACKTKIQKIRYRFKHKETDTHTWEIDQFLGPLEGFWLAEVELSSTTELVELPPFIAEEVTDDEGYQNARLSLI